MIMGCSVCRGPRNTEATEPARPNWPFSMRRWRGFARQAAQWARTDNGRAGAYGSRHRRAEKALLAEDPLLRRGLVPTLFGTEFGIGPSLAADSRRTSGR